ncbi:hypothetical protein [Thiohalophilus thiocyanatoxydans]|uniref:hypothetical protein n=1 Tax=Thiohalophilus thiocyanatoxydans TaxID=381308 RepID=UPI0010648BAE|nr:hypothetical protein [Thiohalophilus thiocyanatoxydans]
MSICSDPAVGDTGAEIEALKQRIEALEQQRQTAQDEGLADKQRATQASEKDEETPVKLGGALRFNYFNGEHSDDLENRYGDTGLDLFRLNVNGEFDRLFFSAEYRFYRYMNTIHHGYVGYQLSDHSEIQGGITRVPFGLLPYGAHNFWFGVPYYLGLADDYDSGIKYQYSRDGWDTQLAFFKNAELGNAGDLERYSYDPVTTGATANQESNTVNARLTYTVNPQGSCSYELGLSGQAGQLYNADTAEDGDHWAAATHLDTHCGRWNFQLQAATYEYNPKNPAGVSTETITLGAFADSYEIAAKGHVYVANVAYNLPVNWPGIQLLTCYNDFSMLDKQINGFDDSYINTTGCLINAGPTYTYVDIIRGKNMPYIGTSDADNVLASGGGNRWETRFNINFGIYW